MSPKTQGLIAVAMFAALISAASADPRAPLLRSPQVVAPHSPGPYENMGSIERTSAHPTISFYGPVQRNLVGECGGTSQFPAYGCMMMYPHEGGYTGGFAMTNAAVTNDLAHGGKGDNGFVRSGPQYNFVQAIDTTSPNNTVIEVDPDFSSLVYVDRNQIGYYTRFLVYFLFGAPSNEFAVSASLVDENSLFTQVVNVHFVWWAKA